MRRYLVRVRLPGRKEPRPDDILLTGTGRSGTTLSCHLLNKVPNTVALFEPMKARRLGRLSTREEMCDRVERFCRRQRRSIREDRTAISKQGSSGAVPDNPFGAERSAAGLRQSEISKGEIAIDKPLSGDFTLVVKHISAFTALLGDLVERFPVYAIVRNPLPVLASWNSIEFDLQQGRIPAAEMISGDLSSDLDRIDDALDRQLHVLGWFHQQFRTYLPPERILRYEDIVASGGAALEVVTPGAAQLAEPLESRNSSLEYDREALPTIAERLLQSEGAHWQSYSRESVEELLSLAQEA